MYGAPKHAPDRPEYNDIPEQSSQVEKTRDLDELVLDITPQLTSLHQDIDTQLGEAWKIYTQRLEMAMDEMRWLMVSDAPDAAGELMRTLDMLTSSAYTASTRTVLRYHLQSLVRHDTRDVSGESLHELSQQEKIVYLYLLFTSGLLQEHPRTLLGESAADTVDAVDGVDIWHAIDSTLNDLLPAWQTFEAHQHDIMQLVSEARNAYDTPLVWGQKSIFLANHLRNNPPQDYLHQQAWVAYLGTHHPTIRDLHHRKDAPRTRGQLVWSMSHQKLCPEDIFLVEQYLAWSSTVLPTVTVPWSPEHSNDRRHDPLIDHLDTYFASRELSRREEWYRHFHQQLEEFATQPWSPHLAAQREDVLVMAADVYALLPADTLDHLPDISTHYLAYAQAVVTNSRSDLHIAYALSHVTDPQDHLNLWRQYIEQRNETDSPAHLPPRFVLDGMSHIDIAPLTTHDLRTTLQSRTELLDHPSWSPDNTYRLDQTTQNQDLTEGQLARYKEFFGYDADAAQANDVLAPRRSQRKETVDQIVTSVAPISLGPDHRENLKLDEMMPRGKEVFYAALVSAYAEHMIGRAVETDSSTELDSIAREVAEAIDICRQEIVLDTIWDDRLTVLLWWVADQLIGKQLFLQLSANDTFNALSEDELEQGWFSSSRLALITAARDQLAQQAPRDQLIVHAEQSHQLHDTIQRQEVGEQSSLIGWLVWLLWLRKLKFWKSSRTARKQRAHPQERAAYTAGRKSVPLMRWILASSLVWWGVWAWAMYWMMKDSFLRIDGSVSLPEYQDKTTEFYASIVKADLGVLQVDRERDIGATFMHNFSLLGNSLDEGSRTKRTWDWIRERTWTDQYHLHTKWTLEFVYDLHDMVHDIHIEHIPGAPDEEYILIQLPPLNIKSLVTNMDAATRRSFWWRHLDAWWIQPQEADKLFGGMFEYAKQKAIIDAYEQWHLTSYIAEAEASITETLTTLLIRQHGLSDQQIDIVFSNDAIDFSTFLEKYDMSTLSEDFQRRLEENQDILEQMGNGSPPPQQEFLD